MFCFWLNINCVNKLLNTLIYKWSVKSHVFPPYKSNMKFFSWSCMTPIIFNLFLSGSKNRSIWRVLSPRSNTSAVYFAQISREFGGLGANQLLSTYDTLVTNPGNAYNKHIYHTSLYCALDCMGCARFATRPLPRVCILLERLVIIGRLQSSWSITMTTRALFMLTLNPTGTTTCQLDSISSCWKPEMSYWLSQENQVKVPSAAATWEGGHFPGSRSPRRISF